MAIAAFRGGSAFSGTLFGKSKNIMQTAARVKLGLLDPSRVVKNAQGNAVGWRPGANKGTNSAMSDPLKWSETVLIPALKKAGVNTKRSSIAQTLGIPHRPS